MSNLPFRKKLKAFCDENEKAEKECKDLILPFIKSCVAVAWKLRIQDVPMGVDRDEVGTMLVSDESHHMRDGQYDFDKTDDDKVLWPTLFALGTRRKVDNDVMNCPLQSTLV